MKVSILTSAYIYRYSLEDSIRKAAETGFDAVDICAWYPHAEPKLIDRKGRRALRDLLASYGISVNQIATLGDVSNGIWPMMGGYAESIQDRLDFAADIGARCVEVLPGFTRPDLPRHLTWKWAVESYQKLARHAELVGVPLAMEFEPHQPTQYMWGKPAPMNAYDLATLTKLVQDIGHDYCKVNLDIGHVNIIAKGDPESVRDDLWALKGQIISTHCNDNDGVTDLNLIPGQGTCDFRYYFDRLNQMGYQGTIGIELEGADDPDHLVQESYRYVRSTLDALNLYG
jgi:sugar phosphate isomerase/epimerase